MTTTRAGPWDQQRHAGGSRHSCHEDFGVGVGSSIKNRENNRRLRRDWFDPLCTNVEEETSPDALVGIERKDPATFSSRLQSAPAKITLG
jgi:hypothetical protein